MKNDIRICAFYGIFIIAMKHIGKYLYLQEENRFNWRDSISFRHFNANVIFLFWTNMLGQRNPLM